MLNGLDLFSGIGGIQLGLSPWVSTIAYCEADRYCQGVLLSRMESGEIDKAPIWDDIRTLTGKTIGREIDIISGGFPCQDISVAGNGKGLEGERSGLFFEVIRLVGELRPRYVFLENVPAISIRGLDQVLLEVTALGYDCRWTIVSAAEVGAPHRRERWFMLAHSRSESLWIPESGQWHQEIYASTALEDGSATYTNRKRGKVVRHSFRHESKQPFGIDLLEGDSWDEYASFFHRVDHGIPLRSHRLKGLGNAVVPLQARVAFERLTGMSDE